MRVIEKTIAFFLATAILISVFSSALFVKAFETLGGYEDINLRVGIHYGTGAVSSCTFSCDASFEMGRIENGRSFASEYLLAAKKITVFSDTAYHLQLPTVYSSSVELNRAISTYENIFISNGIPYFAAIDQSGYRLRFGNYATIEELNADIQKIESLFEFQLCTPSSNTISVKDAKSGEILYQREGGPFGIMPKNSQRRTTLESGSVFGGAFEITKTARGLTVINVVDLEEYVAGVLPYEIVPSWGIEMQKTFAIIARTYALFNLNKHLSYNFDVCTTTACQVYGGYTRVNSSILKAVDQTKGQVLTYDGKLCETLYSSSLGGSSISVQQAFGGYSRPYLRGNIFDWEPYESFANGKWQSTVSAKELCTYLKNQGYSVSGYIKSVEIRQLGENSTYAYIVDITDSIGNVITLKTSEKIRTTLTKYLKSANFTVTHQIKEPSYIEEKPAGAVLTADGLKYMDENDAVYVQGGSGVATVGDKTEIFVYAGDKGKISFSLTYEFEELKAIKATNEAMLQSAYVTANFIFDGKGFGHGVGLSQYGANYLAEIGKTPYEILTTFYPDTKIMTVG